MTAIEEMAGMDVLCSDKTGTLTLNKLTVDKNLVEVIYGDADGPHAASATSSSYVLFEYNFGGSYVLTSDMHGGRSPVQYSNHQATISLRIALLSSCFILISR